MVEISSSNKYLICLVNFLRRRRNKKKRRGGEGGVVVRVRIGNREHSSLKMVVVLLRSHNFGVRVGGWV